MTYLAANHASSVRRNLALFREYGRWDDLTELYGISVLDDEIVRIIKTQLDSDIANMYLKKGASLLAKWLPSVNTSSQSARNKSKKPFTRPRYVADAVP